MIRIKTTFFELFLKSIFIAGASNLTYKVEIMWKEQVFAVVVKKFVNKLVDFRIENLIFKELSDCGDGPYL